jgi:hypothetical protein
MTEADAVIVRSQLLSTECFRDDVVRSIRRLLNARLMIDLST